MQQVGWTGVRKRGLANDAFEIIILHIVTVLVEDLEFIHILARLVWAVESKCILGRMTLKHERPKRVVAWGTSRIGPQGELAELAYAYSPMTLRFRARWYTSSPTSAVLSLVYVLILLLTTGPG